jgi:hypothetical protein
LHYGRKFRSRRSSPLLALPQNPLFIASSCPFCNQKLLADLVAFQVKCLPKPMSPRSRAAWLLSQACQVSAASSSMPNLFFATAPAQLIRLGERGGPTTQWMALQEQGIAAGIYQSPMRAAISTLKDSARSFHSSSSAYHGGGGSTPSAET